EGLKVSPISSKGLAGNSGTSCQRLQLTGGAIWRLSAMAQDGMEIFLFHPAEPVHYRSHWERPAICTASRDCIEEP
ncbi:MAG: hypothetical protein VX633_04325, partial [Verrucomicrobiota bacterium]|nr:hypothetical protein [Verrucomicrobiota bacterium]